MRNPGGYATIEGGKGTFVSFASGQKTLLTSDKHEVDTWACIHCNKQVHAVDPDYFFCRNCMARICGPCADHPCAPFIKKVEAQEERTYRLRCYGE